MLRQTLTLAIFAAAAQGAGPTLLILHKGASSLGFYSSAGELETAVAVGEHPHEIAQSPDGRFVYITDNGTMRIENPGSGGNTVSIVDIAARKKTGAIALGNYRRPHGIDIDASGKHLAVTTELPDQLLWIDIATRSILRTYDTKGKTSHMVTLGLDAKWAYVSNISSSSVSAIRLETGEVRVIGCGARPEGSVLSRDGKYVYVANREARSITIIDTSKNEAAGTIATGNGPVRIRRDPRSGLLIYAVMHDRAVEFADPAARKVVGRVALPANADLASLQVSSDGRFATTSAEEDDTVYVISVPDRKLVRTIRVQKGFAPDPALWLE